MKIPISVQEPTTVKITAVGKPIKLITCYDGAKVYYERGFEGDDIRVAKFNIPDRGAYIIDIDGDFVIATKSIERSEKGWSIKLPAPQKDTKKTLGTYSFRKIAGWDNSPAMISTQKKEIYTNVKFDSMPTYAQKFIIAHEYGHRFYVSEFFCDLYATKWMLTHGYNESSCVLSLSKVLRNDPANLMRIKNVLGNLTS